MKKRILYHLAFWTGYILFKGYLNLESVSSSLTAKILAVSMLGQSAFLIVKVPMVYTLFYIIEKYLAKKWRMAATITVTLALMIASIALYLCVREYIVLEMIYHVHGSLAKSLSLVTILYTFFVLAFTCSAAVAIKLVRSNIRQREAEQETIKRKLEAELRFLKAQINPHFLFNTFSNIYSLARKRSGETANAVMKLSELFRFILYESQKKYISIEDEIHVLENYIELESIRYNDKVEIGFTKSVDNVSQPIAPLILLPFVENTFKHGASESLTESYIYINLKLKENQLYFICENSKAGNDDESKTERIGLVNIRRQLELLYPEHTLEIENTNTRFKVSLKVNLHPNKRVIL